MANYHVTCITKRGGHYAPHERISHIGFATTNGTERFTSDQAIGCIRRGQHQFYVDSGGHTTWLRVASRNGRDYLKTDADGVTPDNLLALPECG